MELSVGDDARSIEAVIFDMDGLLINTELLAMRALGAAASGMGIDVPEAFCHLLIGVPADQCRRMSGDRYGSDFPVQAYFESANLHMTEMVEAGQLRLKPGVSELLTCLEQQRIPKAVATSSARGKAMHHLWMTGILSRFDAVVTRDDVEHGKPHPALYLHAAERLSTSPDCCLALEASYDGVRAARAANIRVIMVSNLLAPTEEMWSMCETVAPDLDAIRGLLGQMDGVASTPAKAA